MNQFGASAPQPSSTAQAKRSWVRRIAAVAGFAMVPGLLSPVAFADAPKPLGAPDLNPPRASKVVPLTSKVDKETARIMAESEAATLDAAKRARTDQQRPVTWPHSSQETLTLGADGQDTAKPGALPVTLAAPKQTKGRQKARTAQAVTVKVLGQKQARKLGVKGVVLTVTGPATGGAARVGIDYSAFASAYGGDWAGRLQIQRLPDCALDAPGKAACRTRTSLRFTNDRERERLNTQLTFATAPARTASAGETMVLALAAGAKSGSGTYKATPLAASSTWEAGGSSGSFTWSYPLRTPPAAAGPQPDLALSYDSGRVDGRTANTNNQTTAVGEGFELTSSYIERKYGSCDDDGQTGKFDLCWKYDNASLVLNGQATELVKDDTSGKWRLKNDDASTVIHGTGADNGDGGDSGIDGEGEHWTVIKGDGTKYVFGLNKLDGAGAEDRTNSVWTVPVFGDDSGEPGYTGGTSFSGRDKKQAWRWNLDYIEDTHGNAMSYWYTAEGNNYDKLGDDTTGTGYTRGGYLREIRYGQRAGAMFSATPEASNKVVFTYSERCIASGTGCDSLTEDTKNNWPDVPFDAICKDGDKCTGSSTPSFFTRKRLTGITTYAWNAAATTPAHQAVDHWALKHLYLDPGDTGDSHDQSLWLDEIRHTGKHGTDLALDPVKFTHVFLPNRVDGATDDIISLDKPRLRTITSETGAKTIVSYAEADCVAGQTMPKVDQNTRRCYPVYWSPNGASESQLDWFQKYPVTSVSTVATHGGSEAVQHTYRYEGGGAWHYNDDPMTPARERTWSIWRGFGKVTHLVGDQDSTQLKTTKVYLRGMNGDRVLGADGKLAPDSRKTVTVTGVKAPEITDSDQYAGFIRESVTYNGTAEVSGTINDPWSKRTATQHKSYADIEAYYVRTGATHTRTNITSAITPYDRVRSVVTTYDAYGMPATVEDKGDSAITGDERCTRTWYARNDAVGINSLISRTRVTAKPCAITGDALDLPADSNRPGDVISDTATAYDTTTWSSTQTPTKGEPQWTGRAKGYTTANNPIWQKVATTTYDSLGRPLTVKDINGRTTATTTYTPAAAGPLTSTTVENAKQHTTTTTVDFATGALLKTVDTNDRITESEYDALGRVIKVWLPNRLKALNKTPNYIYAYKVTSSDLSWIATNTLKGDGSGYNTTYEFYDSLLRSRQTQTPTPVGGRLVSLTLYDDRGLAVSSQGDIWDELSGPSSTIVQTEGGQAPVQTDTTYDGAGRATKQVTKNYNVTRWTTTTAYTGDTVTTTAPTGGQATAVVTNALGQMTESRQYGGPQPTGTDYTTTKYTYTPAGQQETITGPDQAKWSYTYDLFGRQDSATDPDKGTSRTFYDDLDRVDYTFDAENNKLLYGYDELNRKTGLWQTDRTDANKLAAWTFDTLYKGQQDTAVRYDGGLTGKAYTRKATAYDSLYQVTGSQLILPDTDPLVAAGVPKALSFSTGYRLDGTVSQATQPAVGGLPLETVRYTYNATGQQLTADGTTGYLHGAVFSPQGDLRQLTLGKSGEQTAKKAYLNWDYQPGTRRLTRAYVTDDFHGYMPQELKFTQDDAGNVTSIFDAATQGGTAKPDYQCFAYDGHRRLAEAWTPKAADCSISGRTTANLDGAAPYWTSYTYNIAGQRKTETQHTALGDSTTTYTYNDPADTKPHTLDETTGAKAGTYRYDAAGNTESRPGATAQQTLLWNSEGKLTRLTENTKATDYLYDADGELLIRRATGDGDTILYLGGTEVRLTVKGTAKTLTGTRYYTANSQTIAVRTATAGSSGTKFNFLAADHHGTSSIALDADTYAVTKRYTTPFGAPRGPKAAIWPDDKAFLGKPADTSTGLTHIGARQYDPAVGQFISVDPLLELDKPQTLNGYSYSINNPITFSDPTGLGLDCGRSGREACPDDGDPMPEPAHHGGNGLTFGNAPPPPPHPINSWPQPTIVKEKPKKGPRDTSAVCEALGFFAGACSTYGEMTYGALSNIAHTAELGGWLFDSDCWDGGAGAPGCDYGTQFDEWVEGLGYDTSSGYYQTPAALAAIIGHKPSSSSPRPGKGSPDIGPGWFPRGSGKIPSGWSAPEMTSKFRKNPNKQGFTWRAPGRSQDSVRIDKGDPNSKWDTQRVDHVVVNSGGRIVGRGGELLPPGAKIKDHPVEAHIPLSEWQTWRSWNAP
ncbi:RHS repeat-associated core domain-containing protein [Streptomyces sp. DH37]|uniref:RHS repeat-associated core domain-containing protein n=1 Tax=Streptomyces sp. DH37 TaxID=3040122 RepID=UPI0024434CB5|nr:RHS repeat-associated core domain-containing protein [Streptomyces sp. DH37]MDG9700911.1 RHS repeat-associated core domain-containing protein [Streptomyces sp. DH37]